MKEVEPCYGESRPLSHVPKTGNFRVISVDTFDGDDLPYDLETYDDAVEFAKSNSGNMQKCYIYDKYGNYLKDYGKY